MYIYQTLPADLILVEVALTLGEVFVEEGVGGVLVADVQLGLLVLGTALRNNVKIQGFPNTSRVFSFFKLKDIPDNEVKQVLR